MPTILCEITSIDKLFLANLGPRVTAEASSLSDMASAKTKHDIGDELSRCQGLSIGRRSGRSG